MKFIALISVANCVQLSPFDGVAIQTALDAKTWPAEHDDLASMENQMATYSNQGNYIKDGLGAAYQTALTF